MSDVCIYLSFLCGPLGNDMPSLFTTPGYPMRQLNSLSKLSTEQLGAHLYLAVHNLCHFLFTYFSFSLLCRNLSLVREICLVPNKHDDNVTSPLCSHVVDPLARLVE